MMFNSLGNMVKNLTITFTVEVIGLGQPMEDTVTTYLVYTGVKCLYDCINIIGAVF